MLGFEDTVVNKRLIASALMGPHFELGREIDIEQITVIRLRSVLCSVVLSHTPKEDALFSWDCSNK